MQPGVMPDCVGPGMETLVVLVDVVILVLVGLDVVLVFEMAASPLTQ